MDWKPLLSTALLLTVAVSAQEPPPAKTAPPPAEDALFQDMPVVEAASLHMQTLEQAPANVTVVSAADIHKYGYRTLAEALSGVRGFNITYDRLYHYVGVQGFSLPGDFNTRIIVMLNGHPLTEFVYGSVNLFGQDFGLDMDLVQRIEIIRGSSSSLYGSNGIFATINVITKSPVDQPKVRISTENDSLGERKVIASSSVYLGHGANLLISASVFNNAPRTLYFPEFDTPETNHGVESGVDGERGYHTFANLIWHNWNLTAYFNSHEKQAPAAYNDAALFGNTGSHIRDRRDFVRLSHSSNIGATGQLRFEFFYDHYAYDDRFFYQLPDTVQDLRNLGRSDAIGTEATYSFAVPRIGRLTAGIQGTVELRNLQVNYAVSPQPYEQLRVSRPDQMAALFAQQEWAISPAWKAYLGLRYDLSKEFQDSLSPRVALVYQQNPRTVYKFVYGHPFRNPSAYEQYFADNLSVMATGPLRPERAHTFEISAERKLGGGLAGIVNVYDYHIHDLIQASFVNDSTLQQFRNVGAATSTGAEFELSRKARSGLEVTGSLALQRTIDSMTGHVLPNSPHRVAKLRFAAPVARQKLVLSSSGQYMSAREIRDGDESVRPVLLWDATATTDHLFKGFDLSFGVRNLLNWRYSDPTAIAVETMPQDGRSVFLKLIWRPVE